MIRVELAKAHEIIRESQLIKSHEVKAHSFYSHSFQLKVYNTKLQNQVDMIKMPIKIESFLIKETPV